MTYGLRTTIARLFELAREKLRVVFVEGSGSYGTNGADHAAADAVLISKTIQQPERLHSRTAEPPYAADPCECTCTGCATRRSIRATFAVCRYR